MKMKTCEELDLTEWLGSLF